MILHRTVILLLCLLCHSSTFSNCYILLYHTENAPSVQYYDCLYYTHAEVLNNVQGVKYCRQLNETQSLQRDFDQSCYNGGKLWSFEELALNNISASDVLQWSSSMEQTDRYSKYLSHALLDVGDNYICNCTDRVSFGKFCEYQFYGNSISFDDAITKQFEPRENVKINVGSQLHNNRPCYTTWTCDSGLMCLDWRHICDGKQQCMDGLDEDYCEILEFNECEDDEYRCANGMCIPEEYWLDGDLDCMDWTDEMKMLVDSGSGCFSLPSFVCDEHLCPYSQWSCGDGQCISDETDRHKGIRYNLKSFCRNLRDVNYMCEAVTRDSKLWWTIDGGYCLHYPFAYQTLGLDTTAVTDKCAFSLKCALSDSLDQDCQCKNTAACREVVKYWCDNSYTNYPGKGPLISPYVSMQYLRDRDWTKKKPDSLAYKGRVKCMGYQFITNKAWLYEYSDRFSFYDYRLSEYRLCNMREGIYGDRNYSGPHYDITCWNSSKTFNNHSYQVSFLCSTRCISKYRVRDGILDCYWYEESFIINNSCPKIQHHRFQCSSSELTCLLIGDLGNRGSSCSNGRDEFDYESGIILSEKNICKERTDPVCAYFRNYIRVSSNDDTNKTIIANNSILDDYSTTAMPFRSYCNSFFNTKSGIDESPQFCKEWVCSIDQYQCLSGQCISQTWVCDGEWDCSDGSDEQRIFTMDHFDEHNSRLMNLDGVKKQCHQRYHVNSTPFSDICNISSEYPCFRTDSDDPFNLTLNRPCINLTQIGDGRTDCLTGLDERNRLQCPGIGMLGFHLAFNSDRCVTYIELCYRENWTPGVNVAHDIACFHQREQFKNITSDNCHSMNDVMCLNDVCIKNARCNGKIECSHGEDEYRCIPQDRSQLNYRGPKIMKQSVILNLQDYPSSSQSLSKIPLYHSNGIDSSLLLTVNTKNSLSDLTTNPESIHNVTTSNKTSNFTAKSVYEIVRDVLPHGTITFEEHYLPFICNRGVAVRYYTGDTVCFCSPNTYGSQCEFYSDRITVVTHLDLTNYPSPFHQIAIIKVLTTFLFEDQIVDYYEFHVNPHLQNTNNYIKQGIYFLYPRTEEFIQMKQNNRNGTQLYSVRFEAFNLYINGTIEPSGVWLYPILFDFLPTFRLSKILRFHPAAPSLLNGPCSVDRCGKNGICQEIINSNHSSYFCSCHSGYYGKHCKDYDEECNNYCSSNSICKPKHRGNLTGNQHPLCLCPATTFGYSCHLKNNNCPKNPCLNGGSCVVTYDFIDTNNYICLCTDSFIGDHCQFSRDMVNIRIVLSPNSTLQTADVVAATVSYSNYSVPSLQFYVRHQQVYANDLFSHLKLVYSQKMLRTAPPIAVLKVYKLDYRNEEPQYYLLYYYPDRKDINITVDLTTENYCPSVRTTEPSGYFDNSTFNSTTAVFYYHRICRSKQYTNTTFTCFRDLNYLCICEPDFYRAECFGYNRSLDQCSLCLSNGYCLKGELDDEADFLCLCPHCHHGKMCQYSTELMSFTLDSLIVKDFQNNYLVSAGIYISIAVLIFLFGFFNNLCSFLTFIRPKPRKFGVGNYLLIVSIINQCSLLLLLLKIIHIIIGSNGTLFYYENLNLYSCKIVSYLLSVFTRIIYWLTSFVTIDRLCLIFFPTSIILKNPRFVIGLSIFAILTVSGMHVHEMLYYTSIVDLSTPANDTLCVASYTQSLVSSYNRINVLVHYFVPFLIQVIAITITIIQTAFSRARANGNQQQTFAYFFKKQFKRQKEQYATPIIVVLSVLPQAILSFSYACSKLTEPWQRYTLLTTYFLSYLPQSLGFILYVLPSTAFSDEFRQTVVGKRLLRRQQALAAKQQNTEMKTLAAIRIIPSGAIF